ncbi:MAG: hypothetical protein EXR49_07455 [Dehalococcoidia bacterium]|nr:hypothetical protein [Dehalococcoidia bacterium]
MTKHIYHAGLMPAPPVSAQTEMIEAGAVTFGVEFRLLNAAIAAANYANYKPEPVLVAAYEKAAGAMRDRGVTIHVFEAGKQEQAEYLRFDCFQEDPHYHYISWGNKTNELLGMDPVANGDPLAFALETLRTRLPQMLERAGGPAAELAKRVDMRVVEAALARVTEAAYRARFGSDEQKVLANALKAVPKDMKANRAAVR